MCHDRISISDFESAHGIDFQTYFQDELENLEPLVADGLVNVDAERIEITGRGRLLMRSVAMVFDRHLNAVKEGYSKTI